VSRRQSSDETLEDLYSPLEPLDRVALVVGHVLNVRAGTLPRERGVRRSVRRRVKSGRGGNASHTFHGCEAAHAAIGRIQVPFRVQPKTTGN
jgi:hypothetical protein